MGLLEATEGLKVFDCSFLVQTTEGKVSGSREGLCQWLWPLALVDSGLVCWTATLGHLLLGHKEGKSIKILICLNSCGHQLAAFVSFSGVFALTTTALTPCIGWFWTCVLNCHPWDSFVGSQRREICENVGLFEQLWASACSFCVILGWLVPWLCVVDPTTWWFPVWLWWSKGPESLHCAHRMEMCWVVWVVAVAWLLFLKIGDFWLCCAPLLPNHQLCH